MEMRKILLSSYQALDNGVTHAVPIDLLERRVMKRNISREDFVLALQAALHEGDFTMASPGMIAITEAGTQHFANALQLG